MNEKIIKFLSERPALSLNQLEKEAGLPQSLLSKAIKGKRVLNEGHLLKLVPVLEKYGFNPEKV
jgi:predicted transcriptional regulator